MSTPFIKNHQFNIIKRQTNFLQKTLRNVTDRDILENIRYSTLTNIIKAFSELTEDQKQLLNQITTLVSDDDFQRYLTTLEAYLKPFPPITLKQIQKMFPKNKKLKFTDLKSIDFRYLTYLGWVDISINKLFIVYPLNGQFIGIEGRLIPINKKGYCMFCNRLHELALFSVQTTKSTKDQISFHAQYVCLENHGCNQAITDTSSLEKFILSVSNNRICFRST